MTKVNSLLKYADDFSEFFDPRTLVDQAYVDAKFASINSALKLKGTLDGATGTVAMPINGEIGDTYYITNAPSEGALFFTNEVRNGDAVVVIVPFQENNFHLENFLVIERHDDLATTAVAGLIKIATQAIANQGTDNAQAITALTLAGVLVNGMYTRKLTASNPLLTPVSKKCVWTIPNSFASPDVIVQVVESSTNDVVVAATNITSATITITFNSKNDIPAGTYKVIGIGI